MLGPILKATLPFLIPFNTSLHYSCRSSLSSFPLRLPSVPTIPAHNGTFISDTLHNMNSTHSSSHSLEEVLLKGGVQSALLPLRLLLDSRRRVWIQAKLHIRVRQTIGIHWRKITTLMYYTHKNSINIIIATTQQQWHTAIILAYTGRATPKPPLLGQLFTQTLKT